MTQIAVTVIGTNLVMDYGTNEAAVAAMDAMHEGVVGPPSQREAPESPGLVPGGVHVNTRAAAGHRLRRTAGPVAVEDITSEDDYYPPEPPGATPYRLSSMLAEMALAGVEDPFDAADRAALARIGYLRIFTEGMTPTDWEIVRALLGIPQGWTLRPTHHLAGYWTLAATAGREYGPGYPSGRVSSLWCGHRSMQVTATALPLAVARMAQRLRFHTRDCG